MDSEYENFQNPEVFFLQPNLEVQKNPGLGETSRLKEIEPAMKSSLPSRSLTASLPLKNCGKGRFVSFWEGQFSRASC